MLVNKLRKKSINIAVIGASGYTGLELIRLLLSHPKYIIVALTADSKAGKDISKIFQHLKGYDLPRLIKVDDINYDNIDAVFCCVPHGASQSIIDNIPNHVRICDLSSDFRFNDIQLYESTYNTKHMAVKLQKTAVYGLSEIYRNQIKETKLVANPGCYPTSVLLPLIPLLKNGIIKQDNIIIDSKSGVSGAGRSLKDSLLFGEVSEGFSAYGVTSHRHRPEIESQLKKCSDKNDIKVSFTPHLLPIKRGILSTIYVDCNENYNFEDVKICLKEKYDKEVFISVLENNSVPSTQDVRGSNFCNIGVFYDNHSNQIIIISVLDNLVKGASGQAIQNMNIMMGNDENEGLMQGVIFP